jgi:integrase
VPPKPPKVTVYPRPNGTYSVRWREQGRQREDRGYTTEEEADDAAYRLRQRLRQGLPGARDALAIGELIRFWYDDYATKHLSQSACETARFAIRNTLLPLALDDAHTFTGASVYRFTHEEAEAGRSARTINKALTVLSSAYQRGIEWGLVESNPVRGIRRLPEHRALPNIPTPGDLDHLLSTAPSPEAMLMLRVATLTGVRQSELFALEWQNIHDNHVAIVQALDRDRTIRKWTKTRSSRRIPLPESLAYELAAMRPDSGKGLVFATDKDTPLSRTNFVRRIWHPWRRHAAWQAASIGDPWERIIALEWRHLRHYYASRLASVGASLLQCSRWMGHGTIRTTMDRYGFLFDEDEGEVMAALDS